MAVDHALAEAVESGHAVLRFYEWAPHTISFGRNEPAEGVYDPRRATELGLGLVRRPTGGRAVLHAAELTYSVAAPIGAFGGVRNAYERINGALVSGLQAMGVPATSAPATAVPPLESGPCFQSPAGGEVVAEGAKLVGSAQARMGQALLQHGSILLEGDQSLLEDVGRDAGSAGMPATLQSFIGDVSRDALAQSMAAAFELALGGTWAEGGIEPYELEAARRWERERYSLDAWTWRR